MQNNQRIYTMRAEFFDVDSMGVVWHGNYVKFFEIIRCRFLDEVGFNYLKMQEYGFVMPIVKVDIKYIKPICFNDIFEAKIILQDFECFLKFRYELFNANKERLCIAHTSQVAVLIKSQETCFELPLVLRQALRDFILQ